MFKIIFFFGFQFCFLVCLIYLNKIKWKSKFSSLKLTAILSFTFYISIIIAVILINFYLKYKLDSFDINQDGNFTKDEINIEQKLALKDVISDTGRNFAPFTGLIYSFIYFLIMLPIVAMINKKIIR